jgi:hypothetical protein
MLTRIRSESSEPVWGIVVRRYADVGINSEISAFSPTRLRTRMVIPKVGQRLQIQSTWP